MSERPSLQQLSYLCALAEHRHFGRAADACYVTQPALSAQIKELERRLQSTLVERDGRRTALTAAGATAASAARQILRDVDELVRTARSVPGMIRGPIDIAAIPTVAAYVLPRFVPVLTEMFPEVEPHLHEMQTDDLLNALGRGDIDLGLFAVVPVKSRFEVAALTEDDFVLAVPEGHYLAGRDEVELDVLTKLEMLLLEDGHCLRDQALDVCGPVGVNEAGRVQAMSLATLCQMVAAGLGCTLLPASAVPVEAREGNGVATVPFRRPAPSRTLGLVWRASSPDADVFRSVATRLKVRLSSESGAGVAARS